LKAPRIGKPVRGVSFCAESKPFRLAKDFGFFQAQGLKPIRSIQKSAKCKKINYINMLENTRIAD